ncbi:MAG: ABC transporter permease [Cellulosilyticum sp.]|nr:ABC transporter permease [Cellulosilyticum sp.]
METVIIDGLAFALPLFIIAIGGIYSERSGITNLALEGFMGMGAFIGALAAILTKELIPALAPISFYIAIVFAMLGSMLYAMLHGVVCIKFKANQVISGVVMNILAIALTGFLTSQLNEVIFGKPSSKFVLDVLERFSIPGLAQIPFIGGFFKDMYPFRLIIVVIAIISWYVLSQTRYGMRLCACGDNPHAVDAGGVDVAKIRFSAVMVSGALAGLGGICFAYSISANFSSSFYVGYGYLAIAALIFGNWKIIPTLIACILFGFARSGGYMISGLLELPSTFSDLIMTLPYIVTMILLIFFSKNNNPPKSLGEVYDKGKR